MPELTVLAAGLLTTVQDDGRPGHAHLGIPPSGALDRPGYALANRLVGNACGLAALEMTFGGLTVVADRHTVVAVTGPPAPVLVDSCAAGINAPIALLRGQVLSIGRPATGVRNYLAIGGGIDAPRVYGSCATDVLSGIGPPPVSAGDRLPLGVAFAEPAWVDLVPVRPLPETLHLRLHPGPREDWFSPGAPEGLYRSRFRVSPNSNRVAVRLSGPVVHRIHERELPSEGVVTGAVEVPPNGQPLIFLADHPTTGGYPVIGVVEAADLPQLGQARPGMLVRFTGTYTRGPRQ